MRVQEFSILRFSVEIKGEGAEISLMFPRLKYVMQVDTILANYTFMDDHL